MHPPNVYLFGLVAGVKLKQSDVSAWNRLTHSIFCF